MQWRCLQAQWWLVPGPILPEKILHDTNDDQTLERWILSDKLQKAQNVAAKNLSQAVEQARQKGVSFVFSHQTRDQFDLPGGVDLRSTIDNCTAVKLYFSATDPHSIQYLMDIKSSALVERTLEEWTAMGRRHPRQEDWLAQLSGIWPDISENDVLALELASDNTASFSRNGELLGKIDDPDFGQQFVDIWLSTDCTRPSLRATLLGGTD